MMIVLFIVLFQIKLRIPLERVRTLYKDMCWRIRLAAACVDESRGEVGSVGGGMERGGVRLPPLARTTAR